MTTIVNQSTQGKPFTRQKVTVGWITDVSYKEIQDLETGDMVHKLSGYIYERSIATTTRRLVFDLPKPQGFGVFTRIPTQVILSVTVKASEILLTPPTTPGTLTVWETFIPPVEKGDFQ